MSPFQITLTPPQSLHGFVGLTGFSKENAPRDPLTGPWSREGENSADKSPCHHLVTQGTRDVMCVTSLKGHTGQQRATDHPESDHHPTDPSPPSSQPGDEADPPDTEQPASVDQPAARAAPGRAGAALGG